MKLWISIAVILCAATLRATQVGLIKIDGAIGPATANYISRALDVAANQNDQCLIIELDTPGGLATSMNDIVQDFYPSPVPTVVYVSPEGAMAGSAGCLYHAGGGHRGDGAAHHHRRGASRGHGRGERTKPPTAS